jgi:uncharacterized delta-60 repeat protein
MIIGVCPVVLGSSADLALAAPADYLDPAYGTDGVALLAGTEADGTAVDATGRVLLLNTNSAHQSRLTRLAVDGSLDTSYGGGDGVTDVPFTGRLIADPSGAAWIVNPPESGTGMTMSRVTAAGVVDAGFGTAGVATLLTDTELGDYEDAAVRQDGDLIFLTTTDNWDETDADLNRLIAVTPDGDLDTSWAPSAEEPGVLSLTGPAMFRMTVQGQKAVVLAFPDEGPNQLRRFAADGTADTGFGTAGVATLPEPFDAQNVIVAGGALYAGGDVRGARRMAVTRIAETGVVDPSFGVLGIASGLVHECGPYAKRLVATGSLLYMIGNNSDCGSSPAYIARLSSAGILDTSYGPGGEISLRTFGGTELMSSGSAGAQADGSVVMASESILLGTETARTSAFRLLPAAPAGGFVPVVPTRILNTTSGIGAAKKPIAAGATLNLTVAGAGGVPVSGASAVLLNVSVARSKGAGNVTAYPTGSPVPSLLQLPHTANQVVTAALTVKLGSGGRVSLKNNSTGTTEMTAEVLGWYRSGSSAAAGGFVPVAATRIVSTTAIAANGSLTPTVLGKAGVPSSGVAAVMLNVWVAKSKAAGSVTAHATGTSAPALAQLQHAKNQSVADTVVVKPGTGGLVSLKNLSTGSTGMAAEVLGYFRSGSPIVFSGFTPVAPARILNTASGVGAAKKPVAAKGSVTFTVTGGSNVPETGVSAVVLNVWVAKAKATGNLTAYPATAGVPATTSVPHATGQTVAGLVTVQPGSNGRVTIKNNSAGTTEIAAEVVGWYRG